MPQGQGALYQATAASSAAVTSKLLTEDDTMSLLGTIVSKILHPFGGGEAQAQTPGETATTPRERGCIDHAPPSEWERAHPRGREREK